MMKIAVDSKKMGFRPKMSLNLAKMTITATVECEHLLNSRTGFDSTYRHNPEGSWKLPKKIAKTTKILSNNNKSFHHCAFMLCVSRYSHAGCAVVLKN